MRWRRNPKVVVPIHGAGGHGRDIAAVARACGFGVAFSDDSRKKWPDDLVGLCWDLEPRHPGAFIAIADPKTRAKFHVPRYSGHENFPRFLIDPSAIVSPGANNFAPGSVVAAGTTIGPRVYLGYHTHVGPGCTLTRTDIGNYCQIAPGVDIAGDVTIGHRVFVGVGATIRNLVSIGDDATIGAGAVVLHDVPAGATVAGIPARVIKRAKPPVNYVVVHDYTGRVGTDKCFFCGRSLADQIHTRGAA